MSAKIGLVGLPNAGKSTLFQALTKQAVLIADYPFATIEPNVGYRLIFDERLKRLQALYPQAKSLPAGLQIIDIAGLIAGASRGEGLGNQFLSHVRQTDMIAYVGGFFNKQRRGQNDLDIVLTELLLADWQVLDNHRQKISKIPAQRQVLEAVQQALDLIDQQIYLYESPLREKLSENLKHLNLLSLKPLLLVFNLLSSDLSNQELRQDSTKNYPNHPRIFLSAQLEDELGQLPDSEKHQFLKAYGMSVSGLDLLVQESLKLLKLQTFLTVGDKEIKAWLIQENCPAPQAAGVIHSDMARGFIAAEIISCSHLLKHGSWAAGKAAGQSRLEGKNYLMQPDDVADFKFNV